MKRLINIKRARKIIGGFKGARVLVIGDLIMDHFIWGSVKRISPEAPVPVVDVKKETTLLGGSANVVNNIHALGGKSLVSGVVGRDQDGRKLVGYIAERRLKTDGIIVDSKRPTTIKTRVIAHNQQVVRFDREATEYISPAVMKKVFAYIKSAMGRADVVIVSDYAKGVVTEDMMEYVMALAAKSGKAVCVDPKVEHFDYYKGATVVTPNNLEASRASGVEIKDSSSLKRAGKALIERLGCSALLITRGENGMSLFADGTETHVPTLAREVYDVSGAGDTVISVFAMALAAGANFKEAAALANFAAGIVVGKLGTATVTPAELRRSAVERLGAK